MMDVKTKMSLDVLDGVLMSLKLIEAEELLVGIPQASSSRSGDDVTNAQIGYLNEHGSPANNIPPRPHLLPAVAEASPRAFESVKDVIAGALDSAQGKDKSRAAFRAVGEACTAAVKKRIVNGDGFAPLQEKTIEARQRSGFKGTKPLIRTGNLLNSYTYVIRKKEK